MEAEFIVSLPFPASTDGALEESWERPPSGVLVAQRMPEVTVYRRSGNWKANRVMGVRETVEFESAKASMALAEIYESVFSGSPT